MINCQKGEPQQYVTIEQDRLKLKTEFKHDNQLSVTILGKARSGRSSLMNQLFGTEFAVSAGIQIQTKTSWVQHSNHTTLFDVQGFGTQTNQQNYNRMLFTVMMLTNLIIFNSPDGCINQSEIRKLGSLCNAFITLLPQRKAKLVWVVRNFGLKLQDKNGRKITPNQYLQFALSNSNKSSKNSSQFRSQIKSYFDDRQCYLLPPQESPKYTVMLETIKQGVQLSKIPKNQSIDLRNCYLSNIIKQMNTISAIQNLNLDVNKICMNTLKDYFQLYYHTEVNQKEVQRLMRDFFYIAPDPKLFKELQEHMKIVANERQMERNSKLNILVDTQKHNIQKLGPLCQIRNKVLVQNQFGFNQTKFDRRHTTNLTNSISSEHNLSLDSQLEKYTDQMQNTPKLQFPPKATPKTNISLRWLRESGKKLQIRKQKPKSISPHPTKQQLLPQNEIEEMRRKQIQKDKMIQNFHKKLEQQEESYRRRLNLSKQYIHRVQNEQEILRKQLYYCKRRIEEYENQIKVYENIEVFECWKCLQRVDSSLVDHMKVCQGPLQEQLQMKLISEQIIFQKGKSSAKRILAFVVRLLPMKNKKWTIRKSYSEIKQLQKHLVKKYKIDGISQICKDKKSSIRNASQSDFHKRSASKDQKKKGACVEEFLNRCCMNKEIIGLDERFKEFLAGH